jgi:hypothetical protein
LTQAAGRGLAEEPADLSDRELSTAPVRFGAPEMNPFPEIAEAGIESKQDILGTEYDITLEHFYGNAVAINIHRKNGDPDE